MGLLLAAPSLVYLAFFFLLPTVLLFIYSFWIEQDYKLIPAITLGNYAAVGTMAVFYHATKISLVVGFFTASISTVLSFPVAYFLAFRTSSNALLYCVLVSWFSSYLVRIYAWRMILGSHGLINATLMHFHVVKEPLGFIIFNPAAIIIALVHIYLPFTLLLLLSSLRDVKKDYLDAARDLGASLRHTLSKVIIPMASRGTISAFMFTFVLAAGDYVTPELLGGRNGVTTGLLIANEFRTIGNWPVGAAMAFLLLLVFLTIYVLVTRLFKMFGLAPRLRIH